MLKFFRLPFATTGDKTAVPDAVDSNGNVSYSQGYGFDYQRQKTDPAAKNIERDKMNQILFDITTAIAEIQSQGAPDYITSTLNGGTAYSYAQYAIVKYSGALYISLVAANTALPTDATKWALLPTPALLQQAAFMSANAGGTVDAITAAFTPAIAALPAAPGTLSVFVRATGANTSTTPTFEADALVAKTIVKGNNVPLLAGDIAGAGHWLELQYDPTLDKWVLQNPATGVATLVPAGTVVFVPQSSAPAGYMKANGAAVSRTTYAALFAAVGTTFGAGDGSTTFNLPDLRGEFLRCLDDGRGLDTGRALGSAQDGTWVRTIVQEWSGSDSATGTYNIGFAFAQADAEISTAGVGGTVPTGAKTPAGTAYDPATTDNTMQGSAVVDSGSALNHWIKMRPRNVALLACIKY